MAGRRWLVTGASGQLGRHLCARLRDNGDQVTGLRNSHPVNLEGVTDLACDLMDLDQVSSAFRAQTPDVVVHAAGLTNVDLCEFNEDLAHHLHTRVAGHLAGLAAASGARMIYVSTDHLWRGERALTDETVAPQPLNAYARTKAEGETATLAAMADALVLRTNFVGPGNPWKPSFLDWADGGLRAGRPLNAFTDVYFTPLPVQTLCSTIAELVECGATGVFNVAGRERISKHDFVVAYARSRCLALSLIRPASIEQAGLTARRPQDMSLSVEKISATLGHPMPDIRECLEILASSPTPWDAMVSVT